MRYEVVIEARDRGFGLAPFVRRTYVTAASTQQAIELALEHNMTVTVVERPELAGTQTLVDFRLERSAP